MEIRINNQLAALKKGTSFEYVSENRLFTGSDGYSLTITFPLKGCAQNLAIFGHLNRADVMARKVIFDCEIRDHSFYKFGSITITEINAEEVKTQFLEGRSEQNFNTTFDKVYINELDLGSWPEIEQELTSPEYVWHPPHYDHQYVALPWVNSTSGNIQNETTYTTLANGQQGYIWAQSAWTGLSWQPYLSYITKKICEAVGYACDFAAWDWDEETRSLLILNTLPHAWDMPQFARALPHWTVEEFFEKLSLFLGGEFDFDHRGRRVSFAFTEGVLRDKPIVRLDKVIEEHTTQFKVDEEDCNYLGAKNLVFKDCDHRMWKFYSCDWFVKGWRHNVVSYHTMTQLLDDNRKYYKWRSDKFNDRQLHKILYAEDVDMHFIIVTLKRQPQLDYTNAPKVKFYYEYTCRLQPINLFGGRIVNEDEDADTEELDFVPGWIDDTDDTHGPLPFLPFSSYDEDIEEEAEDSAFRQTRSAATLEAGEKEKKAEYYDRIYIGWWDGAMDSTRKGLLPCAKVENITITPDWSSFRQEHFSIRINTKSFHTGTNVKYNIQPKMKTTFKFLSDTIPDVRSLYIIKGKRYLCEKLTVTFTEQGMSQLIKGDFYPVVE